MARTRVKICGVTTEDDLAAVVAAGADAVGIIADVSVETPRSVSVKRATQLVAATPPFVDTVLVTMPDSVVDAIALAEHVQSDVIQIHGEYDATDFRRINESVTADVIAVVDAEMPSRARSVASTVDAVLIDSVDTDGAGGTGHTHDWTTTAEIATQLDSPVILAGGLTPSNVKSAVQTVTPFGIDVASGVEDSGGNKDHNAVTAFINRATNVDIASNTETGVSIEDANTDGTSVGEPMSTTTSEDNR
ncbi:phosphoribosylanthranilate isomerase [Haloquadratum walsbyi]|jgi:phosphoribosylanthranilate isomerase (EC 5.3.1.24)|uniref:N-(5'-phosphoribosyl)anthranilate isomerase n=1 Tax=Haloquadratum walsbyi J07HQW2 TaxID=1238425 RepID=U1PSS6_9EURY|nr:phosphoribosylanthranilate isomerase [Haloquadratum walsbyi]ERG95406.1 MAG: phosphoribosylanthranilate isomerase [Haloquadratum walsbyi J07HQW2]